MSEPLQSETLNGSADIEMAPPAESNGTVAAPDPPAPTSRKRRATVQPTRFRDMPVEDKKARRKKLTINELLTAARKPRPKVDSKRKELEKMWEVPTLCLLCHIIRDHLKMSVFTVSDVEEALLAPEGSTLLDELFSKLLILKVEDAALIPKGEGFVYPVWMQMLRELVDMVLSLKSGKEVLYKTEYDDYMNEETVELPVPELQMWSCLLNTNPCANQDYHQLSTPLRVRLLKALLEHSVHQRVPLTEAVREAGPGAARADPLGIDTQGNAYYFFNVLNEPRIYVSSKPLPCTPKSKGAAAAEAAAAPVVQVAEEPNSTAAEAENPESLEQPEQLGAEEGELDFLPATLPRSFELLFDFSSLECKSITRFVTALKKLPAKNEKLLAEAIDKASQVMAQALAAKQKKAEAAARAAARELLVSSAPRRESARGVEKREQEQAEVRQHVTRQQQLIQDEKDAALKRIQDTFNPQSLLQSFCDTQDIALKEQKKCREWVPGKSAEEMRASKEAAAAAAAVAAQSNGEMKASVIGAKVKIQICQPSPEPEATAEDQAP